MEKKKIYKIPETADLRRQLRGSLAAFVKTKQLTPPLSMPELTSLCGEFIALHALDATLSGWLMVELHNCVWRDIVASIPHNKRILLLPQCLRSSTKCQAEIDELGLLCHLCGHCHIPTLQGKADSLGTLSLVAEGFTSVIPLIENRAVDAVIGVGCLDSLEKAFPLLIDNAVPGLAIPLNCSGCKDTDVDEYYVNEMLMMYRENGPKLLDHAKIRSEVQDLFTKDRLEQLFTKGGDETSVVAREWMENNGKRWRPYLVAATCMALKGDETMTDDLKLAAVAVECFHKASLVHDDIQDLDEERYDEPTVYAAHGIPVAINVGDYILGEGYRLLAQTGNVELLRVAAEAHVALCKGQGMELEWCDCPTSLTIDFVLDIFSNKTVPAFDVALIMGVILAGGSEKMKSVLHAYSRALGIAYQLLDDIEDYTNDAPLELRPSAILAFLVEDNEADFVDELLHSDDLKPFLRKAEHASRLQAAVQKVQTLAESYRIQALDTLKEIDNIELKRLLFRVTKKILK